MGYARGRLGGEDPFAVPPFRMTPKLQAKIDAIKKEHPDWAEWAKEIKPIHIPVTPEWERFVSGSREISAPTVIRDGLLTSVYDTEAECSRIRARARRIAKAFSMPVVYAACEDGDILFLGAFTPDRETHWILGSAPEYYGKKTKRGDLPLMLQEAGIPETSDTVAAFMETGDIFAIEDLLRRYLSPIFDEPPEWIALRPEYRQLEDAKPFAAFEVVR